MIKITSQVKAFLPAGEEEGKEVTAADLKVGLQGHFCSQKCVLIKKERRVPAKTKCLYIQGTVQSPQFQQAVSMFSMALQSGQIAPLVYKFYKDTKSLHIYKIQYISTHALLKGGEGGYRCLFILTSFALMLF